VADFDVQSLEKIAVYIGDRDHKRAAELALTLRSAGAGVVRAFVSIATLIEALGTIMPDVIILGDDFDPAVFPFIRDIRHGRIGTNPFVIVTVVVAAVGADAARRAMQAGSDDIIARPVKEDQIMQRLRRLATNRQAFVVTSDYFGPDRRGKSRASSMRRMNVPNTFLHKTNGKDLSPAAVRSLVDAAMIDAFRARLDSHGYRLCFMCNLINEAYDGESVTDEVKENLVVLVEVLRDASRTARRLNGEGLALACAALAQRVEDIAGRYRTPTTEDRNLLQMIASTMAMTLRPRMSVEELRREAEAAAHVYRQKPRDRFPPILDLQGEEEPPADHAIKIMFVPKGEYLFREGEPAVAVYIVASGTIGIYRWREGQSLPVTKVRAGEFFGEMATADGSPHRTSAIALEDTTISLMAREGIEQMMTAADPLIRSVVGALTSSLRMAHEAYTPKSRHVLDSVREMQEQVSGIMAYLASPSAPEALKAEAGAIAAQLRTVTAELVDLVSARPEIDRRTPAIPAPHELRGSV
jgi:CRP-like cAMP-binding protein/CheY-like chemotaxis protein